MSFHVPSGWDLDCLVMRLNRLPDGSIIMPCQSVYNDAMSPTVTTLMTRPCKRAFMPMYPAITGNVHREQVRDGAL